MSIDFEDEMTDEFAERFELYTDPPAADVDTSADPVGDPYGDSYEEGDDPYADTYGDSYGDPDSDDDEPLASGPLTAEALRLVATLQDWVRRTAAEAQEGHTGPECQWCPLCQFVAVLRGERPEVTERVAEAGTAIATALRSLLDATSNGTGAHRADDREPPADGDTGRVQRIKLGDTAGQD